MSRKKRTNKSRRKRKVEKPPSLYERITDFSTGASSDFKYIPKKKHSKSKH